MSAELSRRLATVRSQPPLIDLSWPERRALWLARERAKDSSELSEHHQRLILDAEAARERAIAERRAAAMG